MERKKYIVETFPEVQFLMDKEGFDEHSYLINDEKGLDDFGSSAFFVEEEWYMKNTNKNKMEEKMNKWAVLKKKQAENITKLAEKYPNDWFYSSEMKKPIEQRVGFAPSDGKCWCCGKNIAEGEKGITLEQLGDYIITGCPYCNRSFCD